MMRKTLLWAALAGAALTLGTGCDDGGSGGSGGGGNGGSGGSDGGSGGSGGSTSTATGDAVNGCSAADAVDHTADATTTVTQTGLKYDPPCIKIKAGSAVKFEAGFSLHPLEAGVVTAGVAEPDATSPIKLTSTGADVTFTFPDAGTYGYYCTNHFGSGMFGAVIVE